MNILTTNKISICSDRYANYPDSIILQCTHVLKYNFIPHKYTHYYLSIKIKSEKDWGKMKTSKMILHSDYLASVNFCITLRKWKLEMPGMVCSGKTAGHAHPGTHTQRKGVVRTSKDCERMYICVLS